MLLIEEKDGYLLLPVKVVPGASRTRSMGVLDGRLKVAVAAPPEKGKANAELTAFIAKQLGIPKRNVTVARGQSTAIKILRIEDVHRSVLIKRFCDAIE